MSGPLAQPLYAHWRCKPVAVSSSASQGKGHIFVRDNERTNAVLHELHDMLRAGHCVQHEIDRYLVPGVVLPRCCVPHADNLPDMGQHAIGILDKGSESHSYHQVHLTLRQCTPLRRRTKRAQREVQWAPEAYHGMQDLLRCAQGTLLGLYAHCSQCIAFANRVYLYAFLRSMLVQNFDGLHRCMVRIRYIVKLSTMEHFCNTVLQFNPAMHHMLNKSGQQVQLFNDAVNMLCDMFRAETNSLLAQSAQLETMCALERIAHSYFERCTRAYRGVIINNQERICSLDFVRHSCDLRSSEQLGFLDHVHSVEHQHVFNALYKGTIAAESLSMAWHVTQSIRAHVLPACIIERQHATVRRLFAHDPQCAAQCTRVHVCVYCTIKRPQSPPSLRMDCMTRQYTCTQCAPSAQGMLCIDLLGRILSIGPNKFVLSCCCCKPVAYAGLGHEFDATCGPHCEAACTLSLMGKRKATVIAKSPAVKPTACCVCQQATAVQMLDLIDLPNRAIVRSGLCGKHALPATLRMHVQDEASMQAALRMHAESKRHHH